MIKGIGAIAALQLALVAALPGQQGGTTSVVPTPTEIDHALRRLEMTARENGSAVGLASAQPATVERIAQWAKKVEDRGFVLVPISMVALKAKSS